MPLTNPRAGVALPLARGGTIVRTSIGAVQFGAPPETIKDALSAGVEVPSIFVMPSLWFSTRRGLTLAELEFPVYYNYFILGRRVVAVTDEAGRDRLRAVLRESLFGPQTFDPTVDYDPSTLAGARADLPREGNWFRRKPGSPSGKIELDDVLSFALYDEHGRARIGEVEIAREGGHWRLFDGGQLLIELEDGEMPHGAHGGTAATTAGKTFTPPQFGLTVLGSSHGFDPAGKTTGFLLWLNRRGILVDPPCESTHTLRANGVSPSTVDAVILTHCHADHDAGVFQKLLEGARVNLYTTPTILGSFLRKYVALTGEPEEQLRRLFVFRPVTIGAPLHIHGGEFRFFYTLHSIPTIGFECYFGGKSFVYSSDTFWDPPRITQLEQEGVLGHERAAALRDFPWHHSLVLHEAGVPPIHTPAANLAALSPEIKSRLRLIHIAEADLPAGCGLRLARTGFDSTIELPVADPPYAGALEVLDALAAVDLFRDFTVEKCREFLTIARRETHRAGALVIGEGEAGDKFYIIMSGEAAVAKDGVIIRSYRDGDFFGETALIHSSPRTADVRAKTDLSLLTVDKYDFLSFLRGTHLPQALSRLARNRDLPSWDLMSDNAVLSMLRTRQRTRLQAALDHCRLERDDLLWNEGQVAPAAWILDDAEIELIEPGLPTVALGRAAWVGDIDAVTKARPMRTRAIVSRAGGAFRIAAVRLAEYLEETPALMLALSGAQYVL